MKTFSLPIILLILVFSTGFCNSSNIKLSNGTNSNTTLIVCNDTASDCEKLVNRGNCIGNPVYMNKHCKKSCDFCNGTGYNNINSVYQTILAMFCFFLCIGCISYWGDKYDTKNTIKIKRKMDRDRDRDIAFHRKLTKNNSIYLEV